jgi:hypothetical protein
MEAGPTRCTQINKILKKYLNGYISAKTKISKLELMQVQPKTYELVLIHCHTIVTTGIIHTAGWCQNPTL